MEVSYTWCMDLARAICYLHNCTTPVIHRDLKPANLLLTDDLRLKDSADGKPYKVSARLRQPNIRNWFFCKMSAQMTGNKGTLQYMAPECLPTYNEKVDIYSAANCFQEAYRIPGRGRRGAFTMDCGAGLEKDAKGKVNLSVSGGGGARADLEEREVRVPAGPSPGWADMLDRKKKDSKCSVQ
eukprot:758954-Hanusia_phi.AAC.3